MGSSWVWTGLGNSHHVGSTTSMLTSPPALMLLVAGHTTPFHDEWSPRNLESCLQFAPVNSPPACFPHLFRCTYTWIVDTVWVLSLEVFSTGKTESAVENWKRCYLTILQQYPNPSYIPVGTTFNSNRRECGYWCHMVRPLDQWLSEIKDGQTHVHISQSVSLILLPYDSIFLQKGMKLTE